MKDTKAFIDLISPLAIEDMRTSGILASVTIAQAILESVALGVPVPLPIDKDAEAKLIEPIYILLVSVLWVFSS